MADKYIKFKIKLSSSSTDYDARHNYWLLFFLDNFKLGYNKQL